MSRRRRVRPGQHLWTRFRVVCSCATPAVTVRQYQALADPEERRRQLDQAAEPGAFGRMRVLAGRPGEAVEYGLTVDPYSANGARNKPTEWRCPKCHRSLSPTALQADTIADHCLTRGESYVDLTRLSGIVSS